MIWIQSEFMKKGLYLHFIYTLLLLLTIIN